MESIRVVRVFPEANLRKVYAYFETAEYNKLRLGEGVLYVNKARNRARLVCAAAEGSITVNYYAQPDMEANITELQAMSKALKLTLLIPKDQLSSVVATTKKHKKKAS